MQTRHWHGGDGRQTLLTERTEIGKGFLGCEFHFARRFATRYFLLQHPQAGKDYVQMFASLLGLLPALEAWGISRRRGLCIEVGTLKSDWSEKAYYRPIGIPNLRQLFCHAQHSHHGFIGGKLDHEFSFACRDSARGHRLYHT
jgi:hypothetical protein